MPRGSHTLHGARCTCPGITRSGCATSGEVPGWPFNELTRMQRGPARSCGTTLAAGCRVGAKGFCPARIARPARAPFCHPPGETLLRPAPGQPLCRGFFLSSFFRRHSHSPRGTQGIAPSPRKGSSVLRGEAKARSAEPPTRGGPHFVTSPPNASFLPNSGDSLYFGRGLFLAGGRGSSAENPKPAFDHQTEKALGMQIISPEAAQGARGRRLAVSNGVRREK